MAQQTAPTPAHGRDLSALLGGHLPTADELSQAYRKARLRYIGIGLQTALTSPLIYKSLCLHVVEMRRAADVPAAQAHAPLEAL